MSSLLIPTSLAQQYDVCFKTIPIGQWIKLNILAVRDPDILIDALDPGAFDDDERLPYWAEIWPSAIGLGKGILDSGSWVPLISMTVSTQAHGIFMLMSVSP